MKQSEWFSDWFNTSYYHILYKDRDDQEAEHFIRNLLDYLKPSKEDHFLDLACGKGRHSIYLNSLGYHVWGCDLADASIACAKESENERLHFFVQDMREPVSTKFDIVLNLFTSIGYFEDDQDNYKTFKSVAQCLNSGGLFVLDFLNAEQVNKELIPEEIKEIEGIQFHISKEIFNNQVYKKIRFEAEGEKREYCECVSLLKREDFMSYAQQAGLQLKAEFGNYDLHPFSNDSERLILIFEKK
ncbi:MAG: class I SAM-dependent methyltransferase [Crocinitomicaceae bacterium]|nr:class I SAM-dependent methyltransferase [Crocinitomicaceae bacterium]